MEPIPVEDAGTGRRSETEDDQDVRPGRQTQEPDSEDDGSVPDKQIARWKGEGGAWLPTD